MPDPASFHTITLYEHQSRAYAEIFPAARDRAGAIFTPAQRDRVLEEIERLNQAAGQEILHLGRRELRANALVGVVQAGQVSIEILPKLDAGLPVDPQQPSGKGSASTTHPDARRVVHGLLVMLSYAFDLKIHVQETQSGLGVQNASWIELLIRLFAGALLQQVRGGLAHDYIVRQETLSVLRGRWDVQRQIRRRAEAGHAFEVIYDDHSADTPLNQVFRYVIELLFPLCQTPGSRRLLAELRGWFQAVTLPAQVTPALLECIHLNRLEARYLPAFQLARLFLSGRSVQPAAGKFPARAFVFDMNMLFERFTAAFLQRHQQQILPECWQGTAILAQSAGARFYLGNSQGHPIGRLRPDILLIRPGQAVPLLVADTKYKAITSVRQAASIAAEDLYQMTAYAVRLNCQQGLLLYPQSPGQAPLRKQFEIPGAGLHLLAATLNLHSPLDPPDALIQEMKEILQLMAG